MSSSKCPHCQKTIFEIEEETPAGSSYKLLFVRCKDCKTVVGVLDALNIGATLKKLASKLNITL
jgi:hypothetical protein